MKKIFLLSLCTLALASCNLDILPENKLTYSNSFEGETELNTTTTSIHFYINTVIGNNPVFTSVGVKADELQEGTQLREWNPRRVISNDNSWKGLYNIIFESNLLLDNIHRTKGLSDERKNYHMGQAEFGLGLSYFLIAQRYGEAVITENSSAIKPYSLSSQTEVLATAIEHAKKAYDILPLYNALRDVNGTLITNRQVASKGTAAALLAHLYAWRGSMIELYNLKGNAQEDYQKSVEYATMIIDKQVGNYSLCESPEQLCNLLSNPQQENPEVIFSIFFDKNRDAYTSSPNEVAKNFASWPVKEDKTLADITSNTSYRLYKSTIQTLFADETDKRPAAFFYDYSSEHMADGKDYAIPYKFRRAILDINQYTNTGKEYRTIDADYVYWRLADMYLLRAECYNKLQNTAAAIADLNIIRNRAGALSYPSTNDTDGLKKAIFREREKEFIVENDSRYADIIRNNYIKEELEGKFKTLSAKDISEGALFLPLPASSWQDKDGHIINTLLRQKPYWQRYQ
jgi:hypothetical protein